jgi:hypothetical protein
MCAMQQPRRFLTVANVVAAKGLTRPQVEAVMGANARRVLRNGWR